MQTLVTGVAGFIGSHLAEALLDRGVRVRGVDCFTDYYVRSAKESNVAAAAGHPAFEMADVDLRDADLVELLDQVDVVFHASAQAGVRQGWSERFADYLEHNVLVTQRLLEACRSRTPRRIVFASSSSVYGNAPCYPTSETDLPRPHSPYGVTKLAAENLCSLYATNWALPTVSLRYFTVYGPRQRPDMAIHRLVESALTGEPFPLFGTGDAVRDFTYVADVVEANLRAADADVTPGTVMNIAGGSFTTMQTVIDLVGDLVGSPVPVDERDTQPGDVHRTGGAIDRAGELLGWAPEVGLEAGVTEQVAWHRAKRSG